MKKDFLKEKEVRMLLELTTVELISHKLSAWDSILKKLPAPLAVMGSPDKARIDLIFAGMLKEAYDKYMDNKYGEGWQKDLLPAIKFRKGMIKTPQETIKEEMLIIDNVLNRPVIDSMISKVLNKGDCSGVFADFLGLILDNAFNDMGKTAKKHSNDKDNLYSELETRTLFFDTIISIVEWYIEEKRGYKINELTTKYWDKDFRENTLKFRKTLKDVAKNTQTRLKENE